jgi:hypothetical protein
MSAEAPRAFPVVNDFGPRLQNDPGMSLRDWFAGQALAGALARANSTPGTHRKTAEGFAAFAYECADAMMTRGQS